MMGKIFLVIMIIVLASAGIFLPEILFTSAGSNKAIKVSSNKTVKDEAGIFSTDSAVQIDDYHSYLLKTYDIDYQVLTAVDTGDINEYAFKKYSELAVGQASKSKKGLLLVIDVKNDMVRLEVSVPLEGVFTDSFVSYIERNQMIPFFRANRLADGVVATSELIMIRATEAEEGKEFDAVTFEKSYSIGAGARTLALIGAGKDTEETQGKNNVLAGDTAEETLSRFWQVMKDGNAGYDLDIYTPESRIILKESVFTSEQLKTLSAKFHTNKECEFDEMIYNHAKSLAVFRYKLKSRLCGPWFLEKGEDGKWRMDIVAVRLGITYTYGNSWFLNYNTRKESGTWKYDFGYRGWWIYRQKDKDGNYSSNQGFPKPYLWGITMRHGLIGAYIFDIDRNGYAYQAGLREGDRIISWEGMDYPAPDQLVERMRDVDEGRNVRISYVRNDGVFTLDVPAPARPLAGLRWGIAVDYEEYALPVVHEVEPGSQGEKLGLQRGDVIYSWNGLPETTAPLIWKNIRETTAGSEVKIVIMRDGTKINLVTIAEPLEMVADVK